MTHRPNSISSEAYAQAIEDARMATDQSPLRPDIVCDVILRIAREISAQRPAQADALEGVRALVDAARTCLIHASASNLAHLKRRTDELEAALNSQPASGLDGNVKQRTGE